MKKYLYKNIVVSDLALYKDGDKEIVLFKPVGKWTKKDVLRIAKCVIDYMNEEN